MNVFLSLLFGYVLGSLPLGWLVVRRLTGTDLRRLGSGNVGAANAFRAGGWRTGLVVGLLDASKGLLAALGVRLAGGDVSAQSGAVVAAVVGHAFPVWLRFRGGKSVATACGGFAALAPVATAIAALVYASLVVVTRISSIGSMSAMVALAIGTWATARPRPVQLAGAVVVVFILARHAQNIGRLARGVEPRLARSAPAGSARESGRS